MRKFSRDGFLAMAANHPFDSIHDVFPKSQSRRDRVVIDQMVVFSYFRKIKIQASLLNARGIDCPQLVETTEVFMNMFCQRSIDGGFPAARKFVF